MNTSFDIKSCAEHLGAEIVGIDLSQDIDDSVFNDIDQAFAEYGVVFFRNQNITPEHQVDFSKRFGALECFPLTQYSVEGFPEVLQVTNIQKDGVNIGLADAGVTWHSDMSWTAVPPRGSALYAVELPVKDGKILGGTLFTSATAAYDALPDDMKARIAGLTAIHSYVGKHAHRTKQGEYNREAMTEEQAIEYLVMKDIPARVWDTGDERLNKPRFVICTKAQLPQERTWRNSWKISEDLNINGETK